MAKVKICAAFGVGSIGTRHPGTGAARERRVSGRELVESRAAKGKIAFAGWPGGPPLRSLQRWVNPDMLRRATEQPELPVASFPHLPQHTPRKSLLDGLHDFRGFPFSGSLISR
jgi:hypothetical protein